MLQRSDGLVEGVEGCEVGLFGLGGGDVSDGGEQSAFVVPVNPSQRLPLDVAQGAPRPESVDDLDLEEAEDAFGERVIVAVADGSDRQVDADLGEAFGVFDRQILGGLDRSSQHLDEGGCDDDGKAALEPVDTEGPALPGPAACGTARAPAGVLGCDRGSQYLSSNTPNGWPRQVSNLRSAASATATTMRLPRRSTACSRPRSSTAAARGAASRP